MMLIRFLLALLAVCIPAAASAQTDAPFAPHMRAFAALDAKAMPAPGGILFLGSSSITFWSTLAADFPGLPVLNRGVGGSMIADSVRYADRVVLPYKPRTIVFYAGDNDIAAGHAPEQVLADFQALVDVVHTTLPQTRILFVSIKPSIKRWAEIADIRRANALIAAYTAQTPQLGFIDIFPAMLGPDGLPRPELFLPDGLHMTRPGYLIWRDAILPYLQ